MDGSTISLPPPDLSAPTLPRKPPRTTPAKRRFDRLVRLVSEPGFERLQAAHVLVVGLGGVGGFAVEGLARSGIGRLTLVDYDVVCTTNVNRQIQALHGTTGRSKAELLAERVRLIQPQVQVDVVQQFYSKDNADALLPLVSPPDFVVDAIDNLPAKLHLIDRCRRHGIPVVSSMGAAGKLDPGAIRLADLYESNRDPFARVVRKQLRRKYEWPENSSLKQRSGVTVVYSEESRRMPLPPSWDVNGFECVCPSDPDGEWGKDNKHHACATRNLIEGSAVFVTSVFGMMAASHVVRTIVGDLAAQTAQERGDAGSCEEA
jgi:tRNA A37 threonylcarbamoyladenosine dehydratase